MTPSKKPITKKIGARRVRTEPVPGQTEEPTPVSEEPVSDKPGSPKGPNDERLKADKPPHY
jgi:hypothetical protein